MSCSQYRSRLADRRRKLAELLPEDSALPDAQQATVAVTWSLSIEAADALKPEGVARPALHLAAVLDPSGVPAEVFTTPAALAYLGGVAGRQVTADDAREAVHLLLRLSLATVNQDEAVRVHALIQRAARDTFPDHQVGPITEAAAAALLHLWPHPDTAAAAWLRANTAALYAQTSETLLASTEANTVLFRAGRSLGETGQVAAARDYFQQLLTDRLRVLGPDHPHTLTTRSNLASWKGGAGDPACAAAAPPRCWRTRSASRIWSGPPATTSTARPRMWPSRQGRRRTEPPGSPRPSPPGRTTPARWPPVATSPDSGVRRVIPPAPPLPSRSCPFRVNLADSAPTSRMISRRSDVPARALPGPVVAGSPLARRVDKGPTVDLAPEGDRRS